MSDPTTDVTKATGLLSNLEKANDLQTFLLLCSFMLVVDCGLLRSQGFGILALAKDESLLHPRLAVSVAILFVVFSLLMSVARPFVARAVMSITIDLVYFFKRLGRHIRLLIRQATSGHDYKEEDRQITREYRNKLARGWVTIVSLKAKAHETKDSYYLTLLKEEEANEKARFEQMQNLAFAVVALIAIAMYNWFAFRPQPAESFLRGVAAYLGEGGGLLVLTFFIVLYSIGVVVPLQQDALRWTYCPSLAREQAAEFDQREADERRFLKDVGPKPDKRQPPPEPLSR